MTRKSSRIQDWVNFNIKSLGDSTAGSHDSDSGFEQSTKSNDFHSLYVEPWTNCHDEQTIKNRQQKLALPDHQQPPLMSLQNNHTTRSRHAQSHQHNTQQQHHDGDKVRIFVAGPSPRMEKNRSGKSRILLLPLLLFTNRLDLMTRDFTSLINQQTLDILNCGNSSILEKRRKLHPSLPH